MVTIELWIIENVAITTLLTIITLLSYLFLQ